MKIVSIKDGELYQVSDKNFARINVAFNLRLQSEDQDMSSVIDMVREYGCFAGYIDLLIR